MKSFLEMFGAAIGWGTLAGALVGSVTFTLAGFVIASSRQALHPDTLLFGAFPTFLLSLVPAAVLSLAFTTLFCVGLWNAMRDTAYAHKRYFSAIGFVVGSAGFMLPDLLARGTQIFDVESLSMYLVGGLAAAAAAYAFSARLAAPR